jgi:hypothetical protein
MTLYLTTNEADHSYTNTPQHLTQNIIYNMFELDMAELIGIEAAILFNQIKYWISKCGRDIDNLDGKWIYNSLAEWHKQFRYWSMYKLRKTIKSLEDLGLIKSIKVNARKWNHTKWYTVDYNKYKNLLKKIKNKKNTDLSTTLDKIEDRGLLVKKNASLHLNVSSRNKDIRSTNRSVENQQIIITKTNYTNKSSSIERTNKLERYIDSLVEKKLEEKLFKLNKKERNNEDTSTVKKENPLYLGGNNKETEAITHQMVELWNKVFEYSEEPIKAYANKRNGTILHNILKDHFEGDLDKWIKYAIKVNSSQFLMGEKKTRNSFKAVFSWLIKEDTIEKIKNGEYGIGDRELDNNRHKRREESNKKAARLQGIIALQDKVSEKKEVIKNKIEEKMESYIKENMPDTIVKEEVLRYLEEREYAKDGDRYNLFKAIGRYGVESIFGDKESWSYEYNLEEAIKVYISNKYACFDVVEYRKNVNKYFERIEERGNLDKQLEQLQEIEHKITSRSLDSSLDNIYRLS